ncbi:MAG: response regulator [Candidatus Aminicenantes bacterium]|nr:response regulator [Candidatus Aminicenantes bacterium]
MRKKVIALADNSYTIRRIVELSFSEIENVEVHSFENGSGLKEKLLALAPDVVITDIKLPEISGYDVCRFINETPKLKHSHVFLMKGSFEAVDNEMIKDLKYDDIVTKPFDSNALVNAVMKKLDQEEQKISTEFADDEPSSFPEDLIEIETDAPGTEGISFSDLRLDLGAPVPTGGASPQNPVLEKDEILPSEEITQGTQPLKDALQEPDSEEAIQNPFSEEPIAEDLKLAQNEIIPAAAPNQKNGSAAQTPVAENMTTDISDEFHERFQEVGNADTSEAMMKFSLEATRMVDRRDAKFSLDQDDQSSPAPKNKIGDVFNDVAADAPVKTMFSEKDEMFDFNAAKPVQNEDNGLAEKTEKLIDPELFIQKVRPETVSPEAELEKLSQSPHQETINQPQVEGKLSLQEKMDLSGKLEDKLTLTIKELIWEIVPSLAEKIIKEEIDKIKAEADNTGF